MSAPDRLAVLTACLQGDCGDCWEWVPDPWSADPEEPSRIVCACGCHDHEASHVETPDLTLEGSPPPY